MSDVLLMLSIETDLQGRILQMTNYFHKILEKEDFQKRNRIIFILTVLNQNFWSEKDSWSM